jgi:hypothetical protein
MADLYEVIHPDEKFMDSPSGGSEVLTTVRRRWVEAAGGEYAPASSAVVGTISLPTSIYNGQKTVSTAGSAEALAASQAIVSGVHVKALIANTGKAYVGNSGVSSSNGYELDPGESVFIEIANLATVYVDVAVNGEGVSYLAM